MNKAGQDSRFTVDILIPVYKPGKQLGILLKSLAAQTYPIHKIILMNTEKEFFPQGVEKQCSHIDVEIHHLAKAEFDHGKTRDKGIRLSKADIVVCMTQDALPKNQEMVRELLNPFSNPKVWASYARQLPARGCREVERYTRSFNYPDKSCLKGNNDLPALGIKTFFCSNVCAAWRRETYLKYGGFSTETIFNEDMIFAGKLVKNGGLISYCSRAQVIHSHNYTAFQQFHRNFDLAVSQKMHPEIFDGISSESEGIRLVKKSLQHCLEIRKPWLIIQVLTQSTGKFLGYKLGQHYQMLPRFLLLWCTMNPLFWQKERK